MRPKSSLRETMTFSDNEYNQRQFHEMLASIADYEGGHTELSSLIGRLEGLLSCLQQADEGWCEKYRRSWGKLEDAYADAIYRAQKNRAKVVLDSDDLRLIGEGLTELKLLTQSVSRLND